MTSMLPPRVLDDGSVQVGRAVLASVLDRLPPPAELRCLTILREARYDTIWLNRSNILPCALTDHDWPYVMEALGFDTREIKARTHAERMAWQAGFVEAVDMIAEHGLEQARDFLRLLVDAEVPTNVPVKEHPGGLG